MNGAGDFANLSQNPERNVSRFGWKEIDTATIVMWKVREPAAIKNGLRGGNL